MKIESSEGSQIISSKREGEGVLHVNERRAIATLFTYTCIIIPFLIIVKFCSRLDSAQMFQRDNFFFFTSLSKRVTDLVKDALYINRFLS